MGKGLTVVLLSLLCLLPVQAAGLQLDGTTIDFRVPSGWQTLHTGKREQMLRSADQRLEVMIWILEPERSEGMMDKLLARLKGQLTEVQSNPRPAAPVRFKDYEARFLTGTGRLDGELIHWEYALLDMEKTVIVLRLAGQGVSKQAESDFNALLQSLKAKK